MSKKYHYVDATATRNHIAALRGAGWSNRAIGAATNGLISDQGIGAIARGRVTRVRDCTEWAVLEIDPATLPTKTLKGTEPFVSKVGATRRIQALLAIGWTHDHMSAVVGFQTGRFLAFTTANLCLLSTHRKVAAMYRQLSTRPGPSEITRQRAARLGYVGPAAWDDIDRDQGPELDLEQDRRPGQDFVDEAMVERIVTGGPRPRKATRAEAQAAFDRLVARGVTLTVIEERHGLKPERYTRQGGAAA